MKRIAGIVLSVMISGPVAAEPQKQLAPNHNVGDPNERICENLKILGSRLTTKRVCGTRAEWADRKRQDREAIEGAQRRICVPRAGC